jgi:hypothetical protein
MLKNLYTFSELPSASAMTHNIVTFRTTTLSIQGLYLTFSKMKLSIQHSAIMLTVIMLSVAFYLVLCWMSLGRVLLCWVLLCWMSLCWVSWLPSMSLLKYNMKTFCTSHFFTFPLSTELHWTQNLTFLCQLF